MAVSTTNVAACMAVYSIARSVVDEVMPTPSEASEIYDDTVFNSAMKVLRDKEGENG